MSKKVSRNAKSVNFDGWRTRPHFFLFPFSFLRGILQRKEASTMSSESRATLRDMLGLDREPVALAWVAKLPKKIEKIEKKARFCEKLAFAADGACFYATLDEEECMGGAKYCGLCDPKEFAPGRRSGEFLVARGIYKSVAAVQRAWQGNPAIEAGIFQALAFAPLATAPFEPDVIFVVCNARQGMELLHANAYDSGARAIGADAGPICSSMAALPYLTGKVTYGFGDVGSAPKLNLGPDAVLVSIPGSDLDRIAGNLAAMRAKKAFPA
jgi:uncharacterized protein (DUF169 family)